MAARNERPRIAVVTAGDPRDRVDSSGVYYNSARALSDHCGEVDLLGPVRSRALGRGKLIRLAYRALTGKGYDFLHTFSLSRDYARKFGRALKEKRYDLLFAPEAATEIAFLETDIPIIYFSDTTFDLARDYYPLYSNLAARSSRQGEAIEAAAIGKARALVFPSAWAARSAVEHYGAPPDKVNILFHGPNLMEVPGRERVLDHPASSRCELLFVGVNWERKGGPIAFDTLVELGKGGIEASLTVCGCRPPEAFKHPRMRVIPFLDKNNEAQAKALDDLFLRADFLLFPSRAENSGFVLSESAAFALPVAAADTGGVPDIVIEGRNGTILPLQAGGAEYAERIEKLWSDQASYQALRVSCRDAYEEHFNWETWGGKMNGIIETIV